jgi:DNA helicase II / ATP-dependent DNA helicase PcrA
VRILREARQGENLPVVTLIDRLMSAGLREALAVSSMAEEQSSLDAMRVQFMEGAPNGNDIRSLGQRLKPTGRVEILTIASCKGLEFDYVIALGMDQGKFPFFANLRDPASLAEERRKFYVILTRARINVDLVYSGFVQWTRRRSYDGPSMFLREIGLAN